MSMFGMLGLGLGMIAQKQGLSIAENLLHRDLDGNGEQGSVGHGWGKVDAQGRTGWNAHGKPVHGHHHGPHHGHHNRPHYGGWHPPHHHRHF